jgi:hypothetical protein
MGRDIRQTTDSVETERRHKSLFLASIFFMVVVIIGLAVIGFGLLYVLKSELWIDIFPDRHLWDILQGQ